MKKFLFLSLLAGLFTLMSSTSIEAQTVSNYTACDFEIKVGYGLPGCTLLLGHVDIYLPAGAIGIPAGIPPGTVILGSKGYYVTSPSCIYYIGEPCTSLPSNDPVSCTGGCGNYNAALFGGNVYLF